LQIYWDEPYEDIYLKDYATADELIEGLGHYFTFYDHQRVHQALDYRTPWEVYCEGLVLLRRIDIA
jgi:putative transposase